MAPFVVFAIAVSHVTVAFTVGGLNVRDIYDLRLESIYWILLPMVSFWTFQATVPLTFPVYETRFRRMITAVNALFNRRPAALQTEGAWNTALLITAIYVLENVIVGIIDLFFRHYKHALANLLLHPLTAFYGLLWGSAFILLIRQGVVKKGV